MEWEENSTITRIMEKEISRLNKEFEGLYTKGEMRMRLLELKMVPKGTSAYESELKKITELFTKAGVDCSKFKKFTDFQAATDSFPEESEFAQKLINRLYSIYNEFPKSQMFIERIVRNLGDKEFSKDSVRLAIVKQFIKYTNYKTEAVKKLVISLVGKGEKIPTKERTDYVLDNIDENIFDVLQEKLDANKKRSLSLLKLADDLSKGRFRTNGRTRNDLYAFAIAFNMTCYVGLSHQVYDEKTDIEKNLFFDYYNDSLLRYISQDYKDNVTSFEAEPTGEGINIKNFAEVIYIYFLIKQNLSPKEKLERAEKLLERCILTKEDEERAISPTTQKTKAFKQDVLSEVFSLDEQELLDYILRKYTVPVEKCVVGEFSEKKNKFTFNNNQNTAKNLYDKYLKENAELYEQGLITPFSLELDEYDADFCDDEDFVSLLQKLNSFLELKTDIEKESDFVVTRTRLLVSFAYNFVSENNLSDCCFPEIYEMFTKKANKLLVKCRYQPISVKNIFDYLLITVVYLNK